MRRSVFSLLLAIAALSTPAFAAGIVITPVQLGLAGAAGSTVSGVINVSTPRVQDNRIRVTFGDYVIDDQGARTEVAAAGTRSCGKWLEVDQDQFMSPERGSVPIVITARIPRDAAGSYWAAAYFEVLPKPPSFDPAKRADRPALGMQAVPRIGVPVIVTVTGTEKYETKVQTISARRVDQGIEANVVVQNTGNAAVLLSGAIALERGSSDVSEEIASRDIESVTSYPGSNRILKVVFPAVEPTDGLDVHAYLRYGPGPQQAVEGVARLSAALAGASPGHAATTH